MKGLSLQWRITLMAAALVCAACLSMNFLVAAPECNTWTRSAAGYRLIATWTRELPRRFDPGSKDVGNELTIVVSDAQRSFGATSWCITALVTLIGGVLAYFASGRALRPCELSPRKSTRATGESCRFENQRGRAS